MLNSIAKFILSMVHPVWLPADPMAMTRALRAARCGALSPRNNGARTKPRTRVTKSVVDFGTS